ncbi:DUF1128 family protein [Macrococcus hajekii]|uniref:DUF1128 family protein n=1 Tax=Macrococcus hajekii TaxID=198482 RepID=A0A4R6BIC7_9STAP|nr:DUF1128 family protein [Macrococcus hajekii]TDM01286.1 DUF1128 family protein [Macrococcus hajekii]GGB10344.1 UPF0435 protein [Macrococcus hajekii]
MTNEEMLTAITTKLKLINKGVINAEDIDASKQQDLQDLYDMVMKRDNISPSEIAAITDALGQLRK